MILLKYIQNTLKTNMTRSDTGMQTFLRLESSRYPTRFLPKFPRETQYVGNFKAFSINPIFQDTVCYPRSRPLERKHIFHDATTRRQTNGSLFPSRSLLPPTIGNVSFSHLIKPSHLVPVNALWLADEVPDDDRSWQARYAPIRAYGSASRPLSQHQANAELCRGSEFF